MSILDGLTEKLNSIVKRHEEVGQRLSDPQVLSNPAERLKLAKDHAEMGEIVDTYARYREILERFAQAEEIQKDPKSEPELKEMAVIEVSELKSDRETLERRLLSLLLPKDKNDERNIFLEIRAGAGGEEAALFASELFRMYAKYAEKMGWKVEMMTSSTTGIGGLKEIIVLIEGKGVYRRLRYESGVHRVQRVPTTEAGGRIHTSTVTVAVLPEAEEVDVQIDPKDIEIETKTSSGPGGQSVNTTYSAVRLTHIPTGIVISCQDERSQLKNKSKAMKILRSRLLELEREKQESEIAQNRRSQVGTGDRSEKIRTYNFPQNRVTDHRINLTVHQLDAVLNGDLDSFIDALIAQNEGKRLKQIYQEGNGETADRRTGREK
jgi:peptide chain release factor 1